MRGESNTGSQIVISVAMMVVVIVVVMFMYWYMQPVAGPDARAKIYWSTIADPIKITNWMMNCSQSTAFNRTIVGS